MGLKIYLLGKFEVYHNDRLVQHWKTDSDKILLKILLTEPGRRFSQDTLVEYLWPDLQLPQGIRNLRGRISELRKTLEPSLKRGARSSFIKTVPNGYVFDPKQCQIDAETFKELCQQARRQDQMGRLEEATKLYEEALGLYRGDFLPEDNHQEWAIAPRERFRQLSLEALERLIALLHQLHRCQEAIHYAERALLIDRYCEGFYRALMRCHADTGNPAEALQVYERCRRALQELEVLPSKETERLYQEIRRPVEMENAKVEVEQALENLQHQLDATRDVKKRLELLLQQQKHLDYLGKRTEQLRTLDDALQCARALKDARQIGWVYGKRAEYFHIIGDLAQARSSLEQARQQFQSIRDLNGVARALSLLGTLNFDLGELDRAQTCYEKALSQLEGLEGPDADRARLTAWSGLARIEARRRRYPEALAQYDQAYRLSQKLNDCTAQVSLLLSIGALHYRWDHPAEAGLHWEEAHQLAHHIGDMQTETLCLNNLGLLHTAEGDLERALALYERVVSIQEQIQDHQGLADSYNNIGTIYDIVGQTERALEVYERSRQQDETISNQLGIAISEMNMGGGIHRTTSIYQGASVAR
jgi:DNA-binding SARP family transcriptional activator